MPTGRGRARPLSEPRRALPLRHEPQRRARSRSSRFARGSIVATWHIPAAAARTWATSRPTARCCGSPAANAEVYAIDTTNGRLLARIPSGRARTASASGPSPAGTRSGTRASCADPAAGCARERGGLPEQRRALRAARARARARAAARICVDRMHVGAEAAARDAENEIDHAQCRLRDQAASCGYVRRACRRVCSAASPTSASTSG